MQVPLNCVEGLGGTEQKEYPHGPKPDVALLLGCYDLGGQNLGFCVYF